MTHLCEHRWALSEDFERNFTQDEHLRVERRVRRKDRDGPDAADQVEDISPLPLSRPLTFPVAVFSWCSLTPAKLSSS